MVDKKINALTTLSGVDIADADALVIWDDSAVQTKQITRAELVKYLFGSGLTNKVLTGQGAGSAPAFADPPQDINVQVFETSGTWTKPAGAVRVLAMVWAGGGSGGWNTNGGDAATGGGGGACSIRFFDASACGATEIVTIGAGGASRSTLGFGFHGGDSSFGTLLVSQGGRRGLNSVSSTQNGGDGGISAGHFSGHVFDYGAANGGTAVPGAGGGGGGGQGVGLAIGGSSIWGGGGGARSPGEFGGASVYAGPGGGSGRRNGTTPSGGGCGVPPGYSGSTGAGGDGHAMIITYFD